MASLALAVGKPQQGAILLGAADAVRAAVGGGVWPTDRGSTARTSEGIKSALSPESYAAAYRQGRQLSVEDALTTATGMSFTSRGGATSSTTM
jgi:imidazolonepropionase-like amidohydrolase